MADGIRPDAAANTACTEQTTSLASCVHHVIHAGLDAERLLNRLAVARNILRFTVTIMHRDHNAAYLGTGSPNHRWLRMRHPAALSP
jgi:hypothetical protein